MALAPIRVTELRHVKGARRHRVLAAGPTRFVVEPSVAEFTHREPREPPVVPSAGIVGIDRQRRVVTRERVAESAKRRERHAAVRHRGGSRSGGERPIVVGERFLETAHRAQRHAPVRQHFRVPRIDPERPRGEMHRVLGAPLAQRDRRRQVQRVKIVGIRLQELLAELPGGSQIARLVEPGGGRDRRGSHARDVIRRWR